MKRYNILFRPNDVILRLIEEISFELEKFKLKTMDRIHLELSKANMIKSIQASLAIEGNSITVEQITDFVNGKKISASERELQELNCALKLYKQIKEFHPLKMQDLLKAHKILMEGLIDNPGCFRTRSCGIFDGETVIRVAPSHPFITDMMYMLFEYIITSKESWLLKACIFHYEFEFIHPFGDGNGRMGRFWQQLLLMRHHEIFQFIPVEVVVKKYQFAYYDAIQYSSDIGESTPFVEFSLRTILQSLREN